MERIKLILDCDPGHDDAVALLMAAGSPELELLAVTTESGNQTLERTTKNALRVLQCTEKDVPVYPGCPGPMVRNKTSGSFIHGKSGLDGPVFPPLQRRAEREHAVQYLIRTLLASDGDITVVTTGPMTNLAMALRLEPRLAGKLRRLVFMGGSMTNGNRTPAAEYNIFADPEAAHVCLSAGIPTVMLGLDVTRQVLCTPEIVERMGRIQNRCGRLFVDMMGYYCRRQKEVFGWDGGPMHDPTTIAWLLEPALFTTRPMEITVDHREGESYGRTNCRDFVVEGELRPNAQVAAGVDAEGFWDLVEEALHRYDSLQ